MELKEFVNKANSNLDYLVDESTKKLLNIDPVENSTEYAEEYIYSNCLMFASKYINELYEQVKNE